MQPRATLLNREWSFYNLQQWLKIRLQLKGIFKFLKYQLTCGFSCLQKMLSQRCILINMEEYALHKGWLWNNLFWSPSIQTSLHYLKPIHSRFSLPHEHERYKEREDLKCICMFFVFFCFFFTRPFEEWYLIITIIY